MGNAGSPHAHLRRQLERGNLLAAEAAALDLAPLQVPDALALLVLIAAERPERFERAAVRLHGRFELESRGMRIADAQILLGALAGLRGSAPASLETIALLAERLELRHVASEARRILER
jgi:hypothetical protein